MIQEKVTDVDTRVTRYGAGARMAGRDTRLGPAAAPVVRTVRRTVRGVRRLAHDPAFWRPIRICTALAVKILIGTTLLLAMHMSNQTFKY